MVGSGFMIGIQNNHNVPTSARTRGLFLHLPADTSSPPHKHRLPLLPKSPQRLIPILRRYHPSIHTRLHRLPGLLHRPQRRPHRHRPPLAHLPRQPHRLTQHRPPPRRQHRLPPCRLVHPLPLPLLLLALGRHLHQPVRNPKKVRFRRRHPPPRDNQVARARHADQRRQPERPARAGDDAEAGFREADGGGGREDAEVRGEGELEAAAEGEGRDGGYGGDGEGGEGRQGCAQVEEECGGSVW